MANKIPADAKELTKNLADYLKYRHYLKWISAQNDKNNLPVMIRAKKQYEWKAEQSKIAYQTAVHELSLDDIGLQNDLLNIVDSEYAVFLLDPYLTAYQILENNKFKRSDKLQINLGMPSRDYMLLLLSALIGCTLQISALIVVGIFRTHPALIPFTELTFGIAMVTAAFGAILTIFATFLPIFAVSKLQQTNKFCISMDTIVRDFGQNNDQQYASSSSRLWKALSHTTLPDEEQSEIEMVLLYT